jgi:hypothetical protein
LRYIVSYTREPASRKSVTNDVVTAAFYFLFYITIFCRSTFAYRPRCV